MKYLNTNEEFINFLKPKTGTMKYYMKKFDGITYDGKEYTGTCKKCDEKCVITKHECSKK